MLWETAGVCVPTQIIRKQKNKLRENYQLLPSRGQGQLCWRRLESAGEFRAWGCLKKLHNYNVEEKCWKPLPAPTSWNHTHPFPRKHEPILPWDKGPCCTDQSLRLHGNFSWVYQLPPTGFNFAQRCLFPQWKCPALPTALPGQGSWGGHQHTKSLLGSHSGTVLWAEIQRTRLFLPSKVLPCDQTTFHNLQHHRKLQA